MSRLRLHASLACLSLCLSSLALVSSAPAVAQVEPTGVVRAGYGEADATWHVGAGAGQHAEKSPGLAAALTGDEVDPHSHSISQADSYGVQSRLSYRAVVVRDAAGDDVAIVKSDSYLAQDYLSRRAAQLLDAAGSDISYDEIMVMASHNHSSPYYMSPSAGVWLFQDVFDLRAFEYHARALAQAIFNAEEDLQPAQIGATTVQHHQFKGIIQRAGISDDGTPRGYPRDGGDHGLSVVRFDSLETGLPITTLINWGQHPEGLDGHDLITGDYIAPLERFVERGTGVPMIFGQGDVGSSEQGPGQPDKVPDGIPKQWNHAGFAQGERGAFLLAQDVIKAWTEIGRGEGIVPFSSDIDVAAGTKLIPGPISHPYPSVSNCRTHTTVEGDPGVPVAGLPDCARAQDGQDDSNPLHPLFDTLKSLGVPVPEHYDAPSFGGVEENMRLKLQAFKIGDVVLASCACEAQWDLVANLESRIDDVEGNLWLGFDWRTRLDCAQNADSSWTCKHPNNAANTITVTDAAYQKMVAQVHNDAAGWNDPENAVAANAEPADPSQIWGNFTHEELPASLGYKLPIAVGTAGDYNGYTVSYREYMSWDDYRKALTAYGPHSADYDNMWLQDIAESLQPGGDPVPVPVNDAHAQADEARQSVMSIALGLVSGTVWDLWQTALPDDVGPAEAVTQPTNIKRFNAATFSWRGGSNAADNPVVRVQRETENGWEDFADQSGEIQTKLQFPKGSEGVTDTYTGAQEWIWTANFEAFNSLPAAIGSTPAGEYRFVVDGNIRQAGADAPYHLESEPFEVKPWDGIEVQDVQLGPDDSVSFVVPQIVYPQTYESVFRYVGVEMKGDEVGKEFCSTCSFRPWAFGSDVASATVTVVRKNGKLEFHEAELIEGRWVAATKLKLGESAFIDAGGVVDGYGETNGAPSASVAGTK